MKPRPEQSRIERTKHFLRLHLEGKHWHTFVVVVILFDVLLLFLEHLLEYILEGTTNPCKGDPVPESVDIAENVFRYFSVAVAGVFMLEMAAKAVAFGPRYFCKIWEAADLLLVVTSFVLDVVFIQASESIGFLLILTRVLRLVRFGHAVAETAETKLESNMKHMQEELEKRRTTITELRRRLNLPPEDSDTDLEQRAKADDD